MLIVGGPYYSDGLVTILHGDCREFLPIAAGAVVTDPPYGISDSPIYHGDAPVPVGRGRTNTWHPPSDWDHAINPEWCSLACESSPVVAWFGHWRKRLEVESAMSHPIRAEIVWAKDTHVGPPCPLAMRDERIWLFGQSGLEGAHFETTVWDEPIIPTWGHRLHKNEKPINLMQRLIRWLDPESVLDPFAGSGSGLMAAKNLGKPSIGIEIEERYCEVAANRCSQGVLALGS